MIEQSKKELEVAYKIAYLTAQRTLLKFGMTEKIKELGETYQEVIKK